MEKLIYFLTLLLILASCNSREFLHEADVVAEGEEQASRLYAYTTDENLCLPEMNDNLELSKYSQEEQQPPETHRTFTRIEELYNSEKIAQIRTTTVENLLFDTTRFLHTVEFVDVFELGEYEFTIVQEINDPNRPFTFHFSDERVCAYASGFLYGFSDMLSIYITDYDGNFIQHIEGIPFIPWMGSLHISFEDFNFDGFLDMTIIEHAGGVRGGAPHHIWIWNNDMSKFIFSDELSEISRGRNLEINVGTKQVMAWFSSVTGRNYIFLEFIEGVPTPVSTLEWIHFYYFEWAAEHLDIDPPEGYTTVLIRNDLITGEEEIWYEIW